ncbi:polygalacturonase inhibitor-like [Lolium perenne]|uniref:polygalacturonase inhibitor-like n=1 Tax=Lolium perenne TaxID=4522 RepID=UPI0021F637AE|nr:polygalacturonase inhibitor-like [Lolium perenne]
MAAFLLLLLLSPLLASTVTAVADQCHDDDHAALIAIDTALGSPYHFASWTPDSTCCDWYNVDCDAATGRVVGLRIFQDTNMSGAIPDAIANLTYLQTLTLHHLPAISGAIPESLAALANLSQLTISYTSVSGPVPSFLGTLMALTLLDLSYNSLTGAIPASLADLPNLSSINLRRNRLSGAIPARLLCKSPDNAYLWLSSNNLSGAIPAEFATVNFAHVDLSRNALTGDATCLFGREKPLQGKQLQYVDVSRNALSFNLSSVEFPELLTYADLSHNAIVGGVPPQVANLTNLQLFNVSYNRMCGEVPAGGNMARFDRYSYLHNKCLCGAPLTACRQRPIPA